MRSLKTSSKQLNWKGGMNKHDEKLRKQRVKRYTEKPTFTKKYIKIKFAALLRKKKKKEKRFKFFKTIHLKIMKIISIVSLRGKI